MFAFESFTNWKFNVVARTNDVGKMNFISLDSSSIHSIIFAGNNFNNFSNWYDLISLVD